MFGREIPGAIILLQSEATYIDLNCLSNEPFLFSTSPTWPSTPPNTGRISLTCSKLLQGEKEKLGNKIIIFYGGFFHGQLRIRFGDLFKTFKLYDVAEVQHGMASGFFLLPKFAWDKHGIVGI